MAPTNLRKFSTTVIKDKSASDQAQVPATVDVEVYGRGATVSVSNNVLPSGGTATVSVYDIGELAVNSTCQVGTDSASNLTVTAINSETSISVRNDGANTVTLTQFARLVKTSDRPRLYLDTTGATLLDFAGSTTTDGRGYVEFYTQHQFFDYIAISGSNKVLYTDQESGNVTPGWINVCDYPTFQAAIDYAAAFFPGSTVYVPPGIYDNTTSPAVDSMTITNAISLVGEGAGSTWIKHLASGSTDLVTISGSDFTRIQGIRMEGFGSAGSGVGINIVNSSYLHISDVWLDNFPSWAIDTADSGNDLVANRFDHVRTTRSQSNGAVNLIDRNFQPIFTNCLITTDAGRCVVLDQCTMPMFLECNFESTVDGASANGDTNAMVYVSGAIQMTIRGAWFETAVSNVTPNNWFMYFTNGGIDRGHYLDNLRFVRSGASPTSLRAIKSVGGLSRSTMIGFKGQLVNVSVGTDDIVLSSGDQVTIIGNMPVIDSAYTTFKEMSVSSGDPLSTVRVNNNHRFHVELMGTTTRDALTEMARGDFVGNSNNELMQYRTQDATGSKWLSMGVFFGTTAARNALTWTRGDLTWITDGAGPRLEINTVAGTPGTFVAV